MKLNYRRTLLVGLAFMSICTFWQMYDAVVPLILKNVFHLNDTISGGIMAIDNVLALFMLPLFGAFSDRTRTRIGSRMPYIIIGTALSCVFAVFMPISANFGSLAFFMTFLGLTLVAMSVYRSPAVALMPDVTPKPLRSKANAVINLMGTVGGMLCLGLIAVLTPKEGSNYTALFVSVAGIMAVCVAVLFVTIKEPKHVERAKEESRALGVAEDEPEGTVSHGKLGRAERRSLIFILASIFLWFFGYNAVGSAFSRYAQVYWGLEGGLFAYALMVAQGTALVAFIPIGIFASKFGRKKTILLGIALLTAAFGAVIFFKSFSAIILFFFALAGIGWASINVNSYPMVVEMSRGADVGRYTGYYYTFSMLSQVITPVLSGALLEYVGYWTLFPYSAIFISLSFVTMLCVRHGDSKPAQVKDKLEAFDTAD